MVFRVTELFKSIEGEGKRTGYPCAFVRLAGCNLRCSYCDTDYSLRPSDGEPMSLDEICERVRDFGVPRVTITGGEPMLQDALALAAALDWCECNIETNGSVLLGEKPANTFYTMDWKSPSSGMEDKMLAENLDLLDGDDVLKFVVGNRCDLERAKAIIETPVRAQVYLSPIFGQIEPKEIVEFVLDEALDACVQVQLHKVIWDSEERGV